MSAEDRWQVVYDAESLARTIRELAGLEGPPARDPTDPKQMYDAVRDDEPLVCQGDIVALDSGCAVRGQNGIEEVGAFKHWLVISNTCDFTRPRVTQIQLVPIIEFADASEQERATLRAYKPSRRFLVPDWVGQGRVLVADFVSPLVVEKALVGPVVKVQARMSQQAWVLLHACLVRFLARDDGRFDPD